MRSFEMVQCSALWPPILHKSVGPSIFNLSMKFTPPSLSQLPGTPLLCSPAYWCMPQVEQWGGWLSSTGDGTRAVCASGLAHAMPAPASWPPCARMVHNNATKTAQP